MSKDLPYQTSKLSSATAYQFIVDLVHLGGHGIPLDGKAAEYPCHLQYSWSLVICAAQRKHQGNETCGFRPSPEKGVSNSTLYSQRWFI
jgi:hypothetical protein